MERCKIFLTLSLIVFLLLGAMSCSEDKTTVKNQEFQTDKEKLDFMKQLYKQYGWEEDEDVSEEERDKMLLEVDIEVFNKFLEFFKNGGPTVDTVLTTEVDTSVLVSRSQEEDQYYVITGTHSSYFISSTTSMKLGYRLPNNELLITQTTVNSNPACDWKPDSYKKFSFKYNTDTCNVSATGVGKSMGIKRNMKMRGYAERSLKTNYIIGGRITNFYAYNPDIDDKIF